MAIHHCPVCSRTLDIQATGDRAVYVRVEGLTPPPDACCRNFATRENTVMGVFVTEPAPLMPSSE